MRQRRFQPQVTNLEARSLLSITTIDLGIQGKILNLQGTDRSDVILITDDFVAVNGQVQATTPDTIGIYADGNGGNDLIVNAGFRPVIIHGGSGNDLIATVPTTHPAYVNVVYGDTGYNTIIGDPTQSAIFDEAVNEMTVDVIGPVAFFYDASPTATSITVSTDDEGTTHVVEGPSEVILRPPFRVGVFDLGPGDDTFADFSLGFHSIVYGGPGDDFLQGDEVFQV